MEMLGPPCGLLTAPERSLVDVRYVAREVGVR